MNEFKYTNFFDNLGIYESFFQRFDNVWEAISKIDAFIDEFEKIFEQLGYKKAGNGIYIGQNAQIDKSAKIDGKAIIGHNSTIGHAAYLRASVLMGDNVHIGHATELKHSIVLSNSSLAHLNYVGDSILGSRINLSGGATLANWRFDKKEVVIKNGSQKIETRMEKLGSIIGDDCFIGVNAVLNPGTILSKGTLVYPLVAVKGVHLKSEIIK